MRGPQLTNGSASRERRARRRHGAVGQAGLLRDEVDDVHAEAVDPAVEPPAHHRVDRLADRRVLPVEVGLLAREEVQEVLAGGLVELPGRARERRAPVRRLGARARRPPSPRAAGGTSTSRASGCPGRTRDSTNHGCSSDVWLTTRSMTSRIPRSWTAASSASKSASVPEHRVDVLVVADVVAGVVLRRRIDRRQPQHVDAEPGEIVQARQNSREVADAVAVRSRRSCAGRSDRRRRSSTRARGASWRRKYAQTPPRGITSCAARPPRAARARPPAPRAPAIAASSRSAPRAPLCAQRLAHRA